MNRSPHDFCGVWHIGQNGWLVKNLIADPVRRRAFSTPAVLTDSVRDEVVHHGQSVPFNECGPARRAVVHAVADFTARRASEAVDKRVIGVLLHTKNRSEMQTWPAFRYLEPGGVQRFSTSASS
jgi:hypothetical protein